MFTNFLALRTQGQLKPVRVCVYIGGRVFKNVSKDCWLRGKLFKNYSNMMISCKQNTLTLDTVDIRQ